MADKASFYMPRRESPLITEQEGQPRASKDWFTLFWKMYNAVTDGIPQPIETVTVGASPFTYVAMIKGQVVINGGTTVSVDFSRDGTNFFPVPPSPAVIPMCKADRIRIAYATPPTVVFFPM